MTDDTPTPTIPRAIVCPVDDCATLIPDTIEDQRRHRRGHEHRTKVDDGIRRALRDLSTRIDKLGGATKEDVAAMQRSVAGVERLVKGIEVPEQLPQMQIARPTAWDDDVEADTDEDTTEDDWADLVAARVDEAITERFDGLAAALIGEPGEPVDSAADEDDVRDDRATSSDAAFPNQVPAAVPGSWVR